MAKEFAYLNPGTEQISFKSYIIGFFLSILLTIGAFLIVVEHLLLQTVLIPLILGIAAIQAIVQLICFLHLGKEAKPRWNFLVFMFMFVVATIIIGGSLLIMFSLDYRLMFTQKTQVAT